MATQKQIRKDGWPCACVKRDKAGNMTHILMHSREFARCPVCKSTREDADRFMEKQKAEARS